MVKKEGGNILVPILVGVLLVVGLFFMISQPKFTGFVTNIIGDTTTSSDFSTGTFDSTIFDGGENAVVLDNSSSGSYTSEIFDAGEDVLWDNILFVTDVPANSSMAYYARVCDDASCDTETFDVVSGTLNIQGRYAQYKIDMSGTVSPKLYDVNISHSNISSDLSIVIESPQNITYSTYDNGSVLFKISSSAPNVWFNYGSGNETYTEEVYKTLSNGFYNLDVWVNDSIEGNKSSVAFTVNYASCGDDSCNGPEDCASCSNDCGICEDEGDEGNDSSSSDEESDTQVSVASVTGEVTSEECSPGWECAAWNECADGQQTRECNDVNGCGIEEGKPVTSQSCVVVPTESCSDGLRNQDEIGVDCGGLSCDKCSFFTIVGSAVSTPVEAGRQFLEEKIFINKARLFIFLGLLISIVGAIVTLRVLRKDLGIKEFINTKILGKSED